MQMMKWSVMALAIAAATTQLAVASSQSDSKGFVEDSSFDALTRSMYYNKDVRNHASIETATNEAKDKRKGYAEDWGLSQRFIFESGFTQGTVGFGVNAYAGGAVKLDTGNGRDDLSFFPKHDAGTSVPDEYGIANAAVKARISSTVITTGGQMPVLPVVTYDDSRLLPETFQGTLITSSEIEGLELNAGHFTAQNLQYQTGHDSVNDGAGLKSLDVFGGSYAFNDNFSASLYYADTENTYTKKYGNLNYNLPLADDQALNFDFNIYKTDLDKDFVEAATADEDNSIAGVRENQDNTIWSLAASYTMDAHTFTIANQRSSGDRGYDYGYGDGGGTIYLANSYLSDFNYADETSWQASYAIDFGSYGVPGLGFKTAYVTGSNIDTTNGNPNEESADEGREHEFYNQLTYTVQDGPAKDLFFKLRASVYRATADVADDVNEVRAYVEYPLDIM
jgi:imipenem/basic amino acid-specific outer membrane pore